MLRPALLVAAFLSGPAAAEFQKVSSVGEFQRLIDGKTLTRPMIRLSVSPQGAISGRGLTWDVRGRWVWKNGYFCRDLAWGGDDLGYNCQEVRVNGRKIRFTSDRGTGDFADFTLR
ncbi:MAG: dihydrodipicolinate reductase [Marinibacterium sp.]